MTEFSFNEKEKIAAALLACGCVKFGEFTLKSGIQSPIYIDMRRLVSFPKEIATIAASLNVLLSGLTYDCMAALPYTALPIGSVCAHLSGDRLIYPRREVKKYGTKATVEGIYSEGETAVIIDDLITNGGSKFENIDKLTEVGLTVKDIVVLVDREMGADKKMADAGYKLHSAVKLTELLNIWRDAGEITELQYDEVVAFLASS